MRAYRKGWRAHEMGQYAPPWFGRRAYKRGWDDAQAYYAGEGFKCWVC